MLSHKVFIEHCPSPFLIFKYIKKKYESDVIIPRPKTIHPLSFKFICLIYLRGTSKKTVINIDKCYTQIDLIFKSYK